MKLQTMKEIFEQCQNSMKSHSNLLKFMEKLYDKMEFSVFWSEFNHLLKYPMIVFQREPVVERTIDFIAKFVTSVNPDPNLQNADVDDSLLDEVSQNKLLLEMFEFLLKAHNVNSRAVRFRCCQLINKILNNLGDDAQIDDDLYDKIYQCMLERLRDREPVVRFHAVMALARLQDPKDENCPVIKAYLYLIQSDPNPEVRRAVLSCIAPSPKTLSAILEKTRDVKDTVRKTAFNILGEKVHIKALSIANRERLLQEGLTDRVESVKEACSSKLLQAWLRTFGGNVLELLGALDVEYSTETCELVLNTLFKHSTTSELIKNFDILDEKVLIPLEKLNAESVLYWNMLCKHINDLGTDFDEDLEKVLPNCLEFSNYIKGYVDTLKDCNDIDIQLQKHFVIQQLLAITVYMDLTDTVSRKSLETLLNYMLTADHVAFNLVKYIIPRLCEIKDHSENMVIQMAETISDIREPITTVDDGVDKEVRRQNDIKVAGIRVKINQLKEELDESVRNQDFAKAADIKDTIKSLDEERDQLFKDNEPQVREVRSEEKTDVPTLLKCQAIVAEMLEALPLKTLNPSLQTLIETLILPGIMNEDAGIRNMAVRSLGMCCLLNKDLVLVHLPLFMQASQIDVDCVRVTALKVMIDLLHMHGTEAIKHGANGQKTTEVQLNTSGDLYEEPDNSEQASKLVAFLTAFLDSQESELRTIAAEGMSKLMLSGRVVSSKILSHLLLLWYNPVTEDDTHLRHCLGTFLPIFAFAGRCNQEIIEESFLPTLKTIISAPLSSPLAEVNADNVAELMVQLTNSKLLMENQNNNEEQITENPGHDSLAITVSNEILTNPESSSLKLFVRILNQLELSPKNVSNLKEIVVLMEKISKVIKDSQCLKTVEKIKTYVGSLLPEETSAIEEGEATVDQMEDDHDKGSGDGLNTTVDRTALNDTAQQLEGSLFQESRTLKRIKSITSAKSMDSSDFDIDVRELSVFPDIQEAPSTPRLIGVKTLSKNVRRTPAKGETPSKGQTTVKGQIPSKILAPSKSVTENTPSKTTSNSKSNPKDKSPEKEKTSSKDDSQTRGRTPTKRKTTDEEKSPIESKSPRREQASTNKESPTKVSSKCSTRGQKVTTKPQMPTKEKSPLKKTHKDTSPTKTRKSPTKSQTPSKSQSSDKGKSSRSQSPAKGKTPTRSQSPAKGETPTRSQTPTKGKTPTRSQTPTKGKTPISSPSPAKGKSTTRSQSPAKGKSPTRSQSPAKGKSPTRSQTPAKGKTPTRSQSPAKGKSPTRSQSPANGKSPTRSQSPAKGKSPTRSQTPAKGKSSTRSQTPTKGKTPTRSQTPTKGKLSTKGKSPVATRKSPSKSEKSPRSQTPTTGKLQTKRGGPTGNEISNRESQTKSLMPNKRKLPTRSQAPTQDKPPLKTQTPTNSKSPRVVESAKGRSPAVAQPPFKGRITSRTHSAGNKMRPTRTNPTTNKKGTDQHKDSISRKTRPEADSQSPSPVKIARRNVKGKKSMVISDTDELSTDSSVMSPRGRRSIVTAPSSDDEDIPSTDSSAISVIRGTRQKRNLSDDDLPSTDSTLKSSPKNTRKKMTKVDNEKSRSTRKKTLVSDDETGSSVRSNVRTARTKTLADSDDSSLRSNTRSRRKETTLTSNDESDKSGSKRSTARKRMDDSDSQTTNSPVISRSRITRKKVTTTAKQSVALQELSADSDTENSVLSSPASNKSTKISRKRTKDTTIDDSDLENTVLDSPARETRSVKLTKKSSKEAEHVSEKKSRQSVRVKTADVKTTEASQPRSRRTMKS